MESQIIGTGEGFPVGEKLKISYMNEIEDPIDLCDHNGSYFYIHGIEILSDYRKLGIGSLILKELMNSARNIHCKEICGIAISENIDFWLKQGFSKESEFHRYKNFGEFAWVSMEVES